MGESHETPHHETPRVPRMPHGGGGGGGDGPAIIHHTIPDKFKTPRGFHADLAGPVVASPQPVHLGDSAHGGTGWLLLIRVEMIRGRRSARFNLLPQLDKKNTRG